MADLRVEDTEPLGVAFHPDAWEERGRIALRFTYLSRGDRVAGRLVRTARGDAQPLVLIGGADGCCSDPWVERAFRVLGGWAATASLDLPLCGGRRSDKLSAAAFDPEDSAGRRLRGDLEAQAYADLCAAVHVLAGEPTIDAARVGYLGIRLGAELGEAFSREGRVAAAVLAPAAGGRRVGEAGAHESDGVRVVALPDPSPGRDWLSEAGAFLRSRLAPG